MKNYWSTQKHQYAWWMFSLPQKASESETSIKWLKACWQLAIQYDLCLMEASAQDRLSGTIDQAFRDSQTLSLFADQFDVKSSVCYFNEYGNMVKDLVRRIDQLLDKLEPPGDPTWTSRWAHPIDLHTSIRFVKEGEAIISHTLFTLDLRTNIWFPWVQSRVDDEWKYYDNRQLALCHTPRLNQCVQGLVALTQSFGGESLVVESAYTEYPANEAYDLTGIRLDWLPLSLRHDEPPKL